MAYKNVLLLQVFLRFDPEHCDRELRALARAVGPASKPVMHNKLHLGYVIVTSETAQELVDRLARVLEVDNFTDYIAVPVLGNPAGKHGGFNSLVTRVRLAYAALQSSPAKQFAKSQILVEQRGRKSAPAEMRVKGGRDRQSPK
ncbi:MAG: hypothetical protein EOS36_21060 [Mesorhizobium sp.]|uniref:hypothetical protein n=1 Tax=Mesorhizobium sp. TaxID=1871066 RepID=UPI000FE9E690|nr:hypothetical protein [Mesorhizobium sp.]RWD60444.1 MAG: hypothetical protein EOS36_21060 [Mesorhizobium sp.]RWE42268.1 MAG: hypothetical protein EOS79_16510 [Mesorhizobium sp.]